MYDSSEVDLPLIVPECSDVEDNFDIETDRRSIESHLRKLLPEPFFTAAYSDADRGALLKKQLPRCTYVRRVDNSHRFTVYLIAERRQGLLSFFSHMVGHWLVPGKQLQIFRLSSFDFSMPRLIRGDYTVIEAALQLDGAEDMMLLQRNIGSFLSDVRVGAGSAYCAQQVIELKGLTGEQKHTQVRELLALLERRYPGRFGKSLFSAMHKFFAGSCDEFIQGQSERHVARLIGYSYTLRRQLRDALGQLPHARHLRARVLPMKGRRLGLFVGVTLKRGEMLERPHLVRSIAHYIPGVVDVKGSFVLQQRPYDPVQMLYIEVGKGDGSLFSAEEIQRLKRSIHADLRSRIEQQRHPMFMPRNDEEVMRHVLTLSDQLKYTRDLPQVHLSFSEQTRQDLSFTVVVLRVRKPGTPSIEECFQKSGTDLRFTQELVKVVGTIRRKYPKEATIFRVSVPQERFFRFDYSVDLHRARQSVVAELQRVMGEFRDYNGGLFSQQQRQLQQLRSACGGIGRKYELLLENYFHSLHPHVMRCVLKVDQLRNLFLMMADIAERPRSSPHPRLKVFEDIHCTYATMVTDDAEAVMRAVGQLGLPDSRLAHVEVEANDQPVIGFLLRDRSDEERKRLLASIHEALHESPSVPAVA